MKQNRIWLLFIIVLILASSCSTLYKSPKTDFTDGFYTKKLNRTKTVVYLDVEDDAVHQYPAIAGSNKRIIDTGQIRHYQKDTVEKVDEHASFDKYSFDIDFLTIPLKFRPAQTGVPLQLNTNLNGAGYFGFRTDRYNIRYAVNSLKKPQRIINHYGFSVGGFIGIGNTAMTPTTTNNNIAIEYDGVVWTKGVAGIIAINNFTVGIAIGFDKLLDENRKSWIYETKPWFGLAFGLNIN